MEYRERKWSVSQCPSTCPTLCRVHFHLCASRPCSALHLAPCRMRHTNALPFNGLRDLAMTKPFHTRARSVNAIMRNVLRCNGL